MNAELICVGTELLLGEILNTDARFLSDELSKIGINVYYQTVVGDNPTRLKATIKTALERSDLVITSGGLGPTNDDITKETLAEAMGVELCFHQESYDNMKSYFDKIGRVMGKVNEKQAYLPKGCIVLKNDHGTAPGGIIEKDGKMAIFLPGPPKELEPMYLDRVVPYLMEKTDSALYSKTLRIFGIGESGVEDIFGEYMKTCINPTVAPYAKDGETTLRICARAKSQLEADALIMPVEEKIRSVLGDAVYGINDDSLYSVCFNMLKDNNMKVSFAESCTGGMLAMNMTDIIGSSAVIETSIVTYCNDAKMKYLGVDKDILDKYTAVSELVAQQMAKGQVKASGADVAVSVTGVAGPGPDADGNPCGLVYVGIADKNGYSNSYEFHFAGSKRKIRHHACMTAYNVLRLYLLEKI